MNRKTDQTAYIAKVSAAVPDDDRAVVGLPNDWFAFRRRKFYAACRENGVANLNLSAFYYIEETPAYYPPSALTQKEIMELYTLKKNAVFRHNSRQITVFIAQRK
jgi:hypothetical protein